LLSGRQNLRLEQRFAKGFRRTEHDLPDEDASVPMEEKLFPSLLKEHLERGTRADQRASDPSRRKWKHEDFAAQAGISVRALTNWKNGGRTPLQPERDRLVALLFGDNRIHADVKAAFLQAWATSDDRRGAPGRARRGGPNEPPRPEWVPEEAFTLRQGLARLYVHPPHQGETRADIVALDVTAETGRVYLTIEATEDTPRVDASFAIAAAEIVVIKELNLTPMKGTALGADVSHPNVTFAASWHLKVPLASDGVPGGIVLAGETLRHYTARDGLPYGIRIELRCRDIDLKPVDQSVLPDVSEKQRAVLRRLLQRQEADPNSGVIALAQAELCGRSRS
jgi:hypothetical protein